MSSSTDLEFLNVTETTSMLKFTWVPPDAAVTGYRVMYGQKGATEQLSPSPGPADRSAVIEGLQAGTMYKVEIITIGVRRESLPLIGRNATEPDECATVNGRCDHICSNIPGGYRCLCRNGFVLMTDAHGCGVCGHCQGGKDCDPMSGVCSTGCRDGWKSRLCNKAVGPPMDLAVTDITDEGFKVTWSPSPDLELEGYRVEVSGLDMVTAVNQSTAEASLPVVGLSPETDYVIRVTALFSSGGWRSQSEAATILTETAAVPTTTPAPADTNEQTSQRTSFLSTQPATSTQQHTLEAVKGDAVTPTVDASTEQRRRLTTVLSPSLSTTAGPLGLENDGGFSPTYPSSTKTKNTKASRGRPPVVSIATPVDQGLGHSMDSIYAASVSSNPQDVLKMLAQVSHTQ
ncbi:collagen alpha-1(XII) chain-like [Branchiostoma floridae]|uniref:Collagen alpha-1(XII) chain-like n=1 Tax=Branchiostoma floridae TaxID=7739 RepID=A0A9J7M5Q1_BRAFL|nr:collagen alpha-1(XII) chain-like [Branchiostoma floridae]